MTKNRSRPPMVADELLKLDNSHAEAPFPDAFLRSRNTRVLELSSAHGENESNLLSKLAQRGDDGQLRLTLPDGVVIGRLGRTGLRFERSEVPKHDEGELQPHIPGWVDRVYHPKMTSILRTTLRRRGGGRITPHDGIYDADDRFVYVPSGYPWHCIGKIYAWTNPSGGPSWSGSGVLVGPRHVLTAGHVCPWGSSPWMMQFVPAFWDGVSRLGVGVNSYVSDYRGWNDPVASDDMAVLRLYTPLGETLGWFGSKTYDDDWEDGNYWTLAGYPGDVAGGNRPSRQDGIAVLDDDGGNADTVELEHHGDSTPGVSGGPFFAWWDGFPYVIGTEAGGEVVSGGFLGIGDEDNNIAAGGAGLPNLINWARSNWP